MNLSLRNFCLAAAFMAASSGAAGPVDGGEDQGGPGTEGNPTAAIPWSRDLEKAAEEARRGSRALLVDFEAEWCGWCKKLDRETYTHEAVIQFVREKFIAVKVDVDKDPDSARRYKVNGLPTILFLDPSVKVEAHAGEAEHDEKEDPAAHDHGAAAYQELLRIEGYREPAVFLEEAQKAAAAGASLAELRSEAEKRPDDPAAQRAYARALLAGGKGEEAEKRLEEALGRVPGDAGLRLDFAEVLRLKGRFADAAGLYRKVIEDPKAGADRDPAYVPMARCLVSLGKLDEAEKTLAGLLAGVEKELLANPPPAVDPAAPRDEPLPPRLSREKIEGLFLRGYVRAVLGKPAEALGDLKLAREADPEGNWGFRASFIINRLES